LVKTVFRLITALAFLCLVFFALNPTVAADIKVSVQPRQLLTNEIGSYEISSSKGPVRVSSRNLPRMSGFVWGQPSTSQQLQIINGRRTEKYTTTIRFKPTTKGVITIPAFTLQSFATTPVND